MVAVMPGDDGDAQTLGILFLTYRLTYTHARSLTRTLQHTHTLTLTLPRTFTLTQSDPQKNKMHIWGSPRRVIFIYIYTHTVTCICL